MPLPPAIDQRHLTEVKLLVERMAEFSRSSGLEIGIEYQQESAGWIENGLPDEMINDALISTWESRFR